MDDGFLTRLVASETGLTTLAGRFRSDTLGLCACLSQLGR